VALHSAGSCSAWLSRFSLHTQRQHGSHSQGTSQGASHEPVACSASPTPAQNNTAAASQRCAGSICLTVHAQQAPLTTAHTPSAQTLP
jgi:hypothetical protein